MEGNHELGLYGAMKDFDIITPIKAALNAGTMWFGSDGRIRTQVISPPDTGYIIAGQPKNRKCFRWFHTYFQYYRVVHPGCRDCYKVVAMPRTLDELFVIHNMQKEMTQTCACKCGVEFRSFVPRLYGAYWYTPLEKPRKKMHILSQEDVRDRAQVLYQIVRSVVTEKIGKDVPVILKRACSEMELHYGDSNKWEFSPHMDRYCAFLDDCFAEQKLADSSKCKARNTYMITKWIEHAASHGDKTYLNYTNGKPILADPPVNYAKDEEPRSLVGLED